MEPAHHAAFPGFWKDPHLRKWNLWGYIDARDVAQGVRLALEKPMDGAVHIKGDIGEHETLLCIRRARSVLGYSPGWSWRSQR